MCVYHLPYAGCLEFYDGEFAGFFDWPLLAMPTGSQNCYTIVRTNPVLNRRVTLTFGNLVLQLTECDAYLQVSKLGVLNFSKSLKRKARIF